MCMTSLSAWLFHRKFSADVIYLSLSSHFYDVIFFPSDNAVNGLKGLPLKHLALCHAQQMLMPMSNKLEACITTGTPPNLFAVLHSHMQVMLLTREEFEELRRVHLDDEFVEREIQARAAGKGLHVEIIQGTLQPLSCQNKCVCRRKGPFFRVCLCGASHFHWKCY